MDQVKDILRQIARYRFWISVCMAALFATGAYVLGSGPVQKETADQIAKIDSSYKDVKQYSSGGPTADFAPIVEQKTAVLTKDVDTAWRHLYDRQAPLLTWPETVSERFTKWGRKWPEDVDPTAVQLAIVDYIEAYPAYAEEVFKVFRPFDYQTGEGVVASLPRDQLLKLVDFDPNHPPKLGEVWSAQERLWVQRTALEVIAAVNRNAKDWNSAYVKEIKVLEVGSSFAQDQRSLAKGETLEEAEAIKAPNEPEEAEVAAGDMGSEGMMGGGMMGGGMMGGGMMGPGMMGAGGKVAVAENVLYLKPENATQYKILPIMLTVLVDQDHVQDLLVEFENSPMSIEVRDFELLRPTTKVIKPEKGEMFTGAYNMMGMMRGGMMGYGGMMGPGMMGPGMMMGSEGMMGPGMMGYGGMMGPGMGYGMNPARKGTDKRGSDRRKDREAAEKAREAKKPVTSFDAYYNIVEVTVYGQARFYNEPPAPEAAPAESPGETAADTTQQPGTEAPAADPNAAAPAESTAADMPKTEESKAEEPKAEAPGDAPKAEEPKAEPPTEAPKADAPTEAPKAEEPKAEAPAAAPDANPTP